MLASVVKALGEHSSGFDGNTAAQFYVGTFPEIGRQNKLDDYNEYKMLSVVMQNNESQHRMRIAERYVRSLLSVWPGFES